jgi:hypothetical protein
MPNDALSTHVSVALARLDALRSAVGAGAPWPLSEVFDHTPEAAWGPPELLAHLVEMVPYWHAELERIVAGGEPEPVVFGRIATDAGRLENIRRERSRPPAVLFDAIARSAAAFLVDWDGWGAAERARVGLHPSRGEITVADAAERMIAGHLEDHAAQLESILGVIPAGD